MRGKFNNPVVKVRAARVNLQSEGGRIYFRHDRNNGYFLKSK